MAEVTETARVRVQKLLSDWDWPDPAILDDILALGEEAVPALEELLTPELLALARTAEREDSVVYYAMELLAALGTPEAVPIFLRAYRQADDDMAEAMHDAFRRLGTDAIDDLLSVIADEALTYYPRIQASEGALNLAAEDPELRARVAEGLRSLLAAHLERDAPEDDEDETLLLSFLACHLSELADPASLPLLKAAFDSGRIDPDIITYDSVVEDHEKCRKRISLSPLPFLDEYRQRRRNHLEDEEKRKRLAVFKPEPAPQPIVLGPKLGRNDPCWCGSGRKYKKCHLAQDEKEKVRL